jgi:DNA repair exonuclease SbcCD ATPase subunit
MYRQRAREWHERAAAALSDGEERATCLSLAAAYADLAQMLEKRAAESPNGA